MGASPVSAMSARRSVLMMLKAAKVVLVVLVVITVLEAPAAEGGAGGTGGDSGTGGESGAGGTGGAGGEGGSGGESGAGGTGGEGGSGGEAGSIVDSRLCGYDVVITPDTSNNITLSATQEFELRWTTNRPDELVNIYMVNVLNPDEPLSGDMDEWLLLGENQPNTGVYNGTLPAGAANNIVFVVACADGAEQYAQTALTSVHSFCGDGIVDSDEECDDENDVDLDGCSSTCQTEELNCVSDVFPTAEGVHLTPTTNHTLTWTVLNADRGVTIELIRDYPDGTVEVVAENIANDGLFEWRVTGGMADNAHFKIECTDDPSRFAVSVNPFFIDPFCGDGVTEDAEVCDTAGTLETECAYGLTACEFATRPVPSCRVMFTCAAMASPIPTPTSSVTTGMISLPTCVPTPVETQPAAMGFGVPTKAVTMTMTITTMGVCRPARSTPAAMASSMRAKIATTESKLRAVMPAVDSPTIS